MPRSASVKAAVQSPGDKVMILLITLAGVLTQFLTLVSGVVAARMLGVEGRGQIVLVAVLAQMASQLTIGGSLPNAITKELASHGVLARDGLHGLVRRWVLWGGIGAVVAGGYFLLTERDDIDPMIVGLAVGAVVMALAAMTSRILVGAMLGEGTAPLTIAMTGVLPQAMATLVLSVALALGVTWNPLEIVVVMVGCQVLVLASRLRSLAKPTGRPEHRLDGKELARIARHNHIGSIGPLDGLSLDRALVGSLIGSAALGLYSAAVALGSLAAMLGGTVAMVALPRIAAAQRGPRDEERALVRRWLLLSALVLVPTVGVFAAANPFVIPMLFGEDFKGAVACGYWYVAASGFLAFRRLLIVVLQGRGRGAVGSWIELALTPFVVVAVFVASRVDDVEAVGIGMLAVAVCSCLALGIAVAVLEPAPVSELIGEVAPEPEVMAAVEAEPGAVPVAAELSVPEQLAGPADDATTSGR